MFKVVYEDGLHVPSVSCDQCSSRISEGKQGNYTWNPLADGEPEMHHTHKHCHHAFQTSNHTVGWYAASLDVIVPYLEGSLLIDREDAYRRAEMLASL